MYQRQRQIQEEEGRRKKSDRKKNEDHREKAPTSTLALPVFQNFLESTVYKHVTEKKLTIAFAMLCHGNT